jgi:hypothetical protein
MADAVRPVVFDAVFRAAVSVLPGVASPAAAGDAMRRVDQSNRRVLSIGSRLNSAYLG